MNTHNEVIRYIGATINGLQVVAYDLGPAAKAVIMQYEKLGGAVLLMCRINRDAFDSLMSELGRLPAIAKHYAALASVKALGVAGNE